MGGPRENPKGKEDAAMKGTWSRLPLLPFTKSASGARWLCAFQKHQLLDEAVVKQCIVEQECLICV